MISCITLILRHPFHSKMQDFYYVFHFLSPSGHVHVTNEYEFRHTMYSLNKTIIQWWFSQWVVSHSGEWIAVTAMHWIRTFYQLLLTCFTATFPYISIIYFMILKRFRLCVYSRTCMLRICNGAFASVNPDWDLLNKLHLRLFASSYRIPGISVHGFGRTKMT